MYNEMTGLDFLDKLMHARTLFREFIDPVNPELIAARHVSLRHMLFHIHKQVRAQWLADKWTAYDMLGLKSLAGFLQPEIMKERLSFYIQHEIGRVKHIAAHMAAWEEEVAVSEAAGLPRPRKLFHFGTIVPRSLEMLREHAEMHNARLGYQGCRLRDKREKEMKARKLEKGAEAGTRQKEVETRVAPGA